MIPVFKPSIKRKDMDGVLTCLISDLIGVGERTREFIKLLSGYLETETGYGFRDYSVGLGFVLDSLEMEQGSSVVISPFSPSFYYSEIIRRGFKVLYADIDPVNGCMSPEHLQDLLPLNPQAVFVHFPLGIIPDLESLHSFGIPLVLDISTAFGGMYNMQSFGEIGDIIIMNLEEEGIITAGGGAVVLSGKKKYRSQIQKFSKLVPEISFLSDLNASLGINQFDQTESFLEKRESINEIYHISLMKSKHEKFFSGESGNSVPFSFPVLLEGSVNDVRQYARKKNIMTKIAFEDSVLVKNYLDDFPCRNAASVVKRCILFPLYPSLNRKNVEMISKVLSTLP